MDRSVYETLSLRMARQPSETIESHAHPFSRLLPEHTEGIASRKRRRRREPAVLVRDMTGRI